jgi:hypothetical protein
MMVKMDTLSLNKALIENGIKSAYTAVFSFTQNINVGSGNTHEHIKRLVEHTANHSSSIVIGGFLGGLIIQYITPPLAFIALSGFLAGATLYAVSRGMAWIKELTATPQERIPSKEGILPTYPSAFEAGIIVMQEQDPIYMPEKRMLSTRQKNDKNKIGLMNELKDGQEPVLSLAFLQEPELAKQADKKNDPEKITLIKKEKREREKQTASDLEDEQLKLEAKRLKILARKHSLLRYLQETDPEQVCFATNQECLEQYQEADNQLKLLTAQLSALAGRRKNN